jgi:hypothetical protein
MRKERVRKENREEREGIDRQNGELTWIQMSDEKDELVDSENFSWRELLRRVQSSKLQNDRAEVQ